MLMFGFTSVAIHSGACVVNDMLDRDFDSEVGKYHSVW
jgi:4-hydroxybenzoate polyprenyltransferase